MRKPLRTDREVEGSVLRSLYVMTLLLFILYNYVYVINRLVLRLLFVLLD